MKAARDEAIIQPTSQSKQVKNFKIKEITRHHSDQDRQLFQTVTTPIIESTDSNDCYFANKILNM